jgi:hypothetical protein
MPQPAFPVLWQAFHLARRGHSSDEYEDAYAANPEAGRFAIADGAAESSYAGLWARLLVDGFAQPSAEVDLNGCWLKKLQQDWAAEVDGHPLAWYAEVKREEGAFATLLGLVVRDPASEGGAWYAQAVGDSCLFQVRGGCLIEAFPLTHGADFGNHPGLIGSRAPPQSQRPPTPQDRHGNWLAGDQFLLMTDALAQWFLRQTEAGRKPWESIARWRTEPEADVNFPTWIEDLRDRDGLRNDDVTLILIDW